MNKIDFSNIGFDYGVKPKIVLVCNPEFVNLFIAADCIGVAYTFSKNKNDEIVPIQMAFLFQNEEPAEKFFEILLDWIFRSNNDGDAVAIDFIENNKEGYTLSISPEVSRFVERTVPIKLKNKVSPTITILKHYKIIDNLGQNYLNFKTNYHKAEKIEISYKIATPSKIIKESKKYFTKKDFNFFKEDEIPANSMASGYRSTQDFSDFEEKKYPKPPVESIEEITIRRVSEMKYYLPLTFHKLQNLWLGDIQKKLSTNFDSDLIIQAICNLTIFERLKQIVNLSPDFTKNVYPTNILDYLLSNYESFNSYYPNDDFYSEEKIIKQIQNDKNELEIYLRK